MGSLTESVSSSYQGVFIRGLAAAYPSSIVDEQFLDHVIPVDGELSQNQQIQKLRKVNKRTGIKSRPVILDHAHQFYHSDEPFKVEELTATWLEHGLPLCEEACKGAIADWGGRTDEITHLVAATCSVQCHPGIDAYLQNRLDLRPDINRTLLSGVGCAGAAALLHSAFGLAQAMTSRNRPANILVFACDINSLGFRAELEKLKQGEFPIGLVLFSDGAGAAVISNGIGLGSGKSSKHPFEILQSVQYTVPNTLEKLQLMPTSIGAVSVISDELPGIVAESVRSLFFKTIASMPVLIGGKGKIYANPADFDWDIHPGGLGIYDRIIQAMDLTRDHICATVTAYESFGNSAGPTLFKVLDIRRTLPMQREFIVSCGFGNNLGIHMLILRRTDQGYWSQ